MQFQLTGKRILITGGTSGVGRALAERLRHENHVTVLARNREKLEDLTQAFPELTPLHADLADLDSVAAATRSLQHTPLDVLVNNAGIQHTPGFSEATFDPATIATEVTVNFTSICYLIHGLLPNLKAAGDARILNINSALGIVPKKSSAVYCATKGALNILTRSLRYQMEGTGIQVMQAFLPLVDTSMTEGRGHGKISAAQAAHAIARGLELGIQDHAIGKVKALMLLQRLSPTLAARLLRDS